MGLSRIFLRGGQVGILYAWIGAGVELRYAVDRLEGMSSIDIMFVESSYHDVSDSQATSRSSVDGADGEGSF